jgi:hypothetical protein
LENRLGKMSHTRKKEYGRKVTLGRQKLMGRHGCYVGKN